MEAHWEKIDTPGDPSNLYRLKVPGGWLYRVGFSLGQTLCFVPDALDAPPPLDWDSRVRPR